MTNFEAVRAHLVGRQTLIDNDPYLISFELDVGRGRRQGIYLLEVRRWSLLSAHFLADRAASQVQCRTRPALQLGTTSRLLRGQRSGRYRLSASVREPGI